MPPNYNAAQLERMAQLHAKAGFNHMHAKRMGISCDAFKKWLAMVETMHLGVSYSIAMDLDAVDGFKHSPAIFGWYIDDVQNYEPKELQAHYNRLKRRDPRRLADWSGGWRTNLNDVMPTTDVYHRQFYPVSKEGDGRNHGRMADTYLEAKKVVLAGNQCGTVPCMDLQGAYSDSGDAYWPNAIETDVMFYMAVTAGVKGVRWCPFGDIEGTPLWKQTCVVVSELNAGLDQVFLLARRVDDQIARGVQYGVWEHGDGVYVVASNATDRASPTLSIRLPLGTQGTSSLFSYRSSSLEPTKLGLEGVLPPLSVEIYRGTRKRRPGVVGTEERNSDRQSTNAAPAK